MSTSTNGQVCFGVRLEEDVELPWREYDDEESWWLDVNGYEQPFELFDADGNWLNGVEAPKERVTAYYAHKTAWLMANPLPFELVNYCSMDCPMYILAVPGTVVTANRGYPKELAVDTAVLWPDGRIALHEFCEKYNLPIEMSWWLTSYWG